MLQARGSRVLGTIALALITVVWQSSHVSAESPTGWQGPAGWWSGATSPCIDAGDPDTLLGDEPEPNGWRINMGACGGTTEASKSP